MKAESPSDWSGCFGMFVLSVVVGLLLWAVGDELEKLRARVSVLEKRISTFEANR